MAKTATKSGKGKTNEEIFAQFQELRGEQRLLANKLSELGMDLNEHKIVMETLRGVEEGRRCFRMVGGVLVERTVGEVLPELAATHEQLPRAIAALEAQLAAKGEEINKYIQNHDIRVQRVDRTESTPVGPSAAGGPGGVSAGSAAPADHSPAGSTGKSNVLVTST